MPNKIVSINKPIDDFIKGKADAFKAGLQVELRDKSKSEIINMLGDSMMIAHDSYEIIHKALSDMADLVGANDE